MIKRFFIENFCSIKDRIDLSFEASKIDDDTFYNNLFSYKELDILKVVSFYGMNASGKSTIVRGFAALRDLIVPTPNLPYFPFEFDNETKNKPISIGIEFSPKNTDESPLYRYSVSYNRNAILKEKFEKMTSQKPSLLYERGYEETGAIKLGQLVQGDVLLQAIRQTIIPNRTFLSMFNQFRVPDFYDAFNFFARGMINITPEITRFDDIIPNRIMTDEKFKDFTIKLLKAADFNITDIHVEKAPLSVQVPIPNFNGIKTERDALFFVHQGKGNNGGGSIEFLKESLGTKKITVLASHLYPALSRPSVMIVDELESSLHPELTELIIKCFLDETINPYNSQLIFTSHETALLNLNLLRRDEINFVYKNEDTCSTFIRSLKEFHARKGENIEKAYLAGRYLTSPEVKENLLAGAADEE